MPDSARTETFVIENSLPSERLDTFLSDTEEAVIRVSALNAYVPAAPLYAPTPLVARIAESLA